MSHDEKLSSHSVRELNKWDMGEAAFRKNIINVLADITERLEIIEKHLDDIDGY